MSEMGMASSAHIRRLSVAAAMLLAALLGAATFRLLPVAAFAPVHTWPHGAVTYYDAGHMGRTVATAALRWNMSGAGVHLREVTTRKDADVIIEVHDSALLTACGPDCLGYTSTIGRPRAGKTRILLASSLGGQARPLAVWVAAHELGHVLGLEHRGGRACSLMSPRAFDTRCSPSLSVHRATAAQLACVPAPADVAAAARLYGGDQQPPDPRCR
jgi:hypothetical protein